MHRITGTLRLAFGLTLPLTLALALVPLAIQAQDIQAAEQAHARNDSEAVIQLLLPAWNRGRLRDARALYLLSRACMGQKASLRFALDKAGQCNNRTGHITWAAADAGNVDAMLDLAVTLDTNLVPLRHPDLPQDRSKAYRAALLASRLATTVDQRERADMAVADVGARIHPAARDAVAAQVAEYLEAQGIGAAFESGTDAAIKPGKLEWLEAASLGEPQTYLPGPNQVKVGEDRIEDESDAGIADQIDMDSITRRGDAIQYVYSGMDNVVLIQASCRGGTPTLIWEADPYDAAADGSLTFHPQARQPVPQERRWVDYYWSLTSKACAL